MSKLNGNRLVVDLLMPQQDKMASAATFTDVVALCPRSASLVPSDLQVTCRSTGREEGEGKAGSRLVCTAALGMEYATAPVQPLCQDVLSSGGKRERKERERVWMLVSHTLLWCQAVARALFGTQKSVSESRNRGMTVDPNLIYMT